MEEGGEEAALDAQWFMANRVHRGVQADEVAAGDEARNRRAVVTKVDKLRQREDTPLPLRKPPNLSRGDRVTTVVAGSPRLGHDPTLIAIGAPVARGMC